MYCKCCEAFAHNPALRNRVGIQGKRTRIFALQVIFRLNSSFYSNVGCTDRPARDQQLANQCQIHEIRPAPGQPAQKLNIYHIYWPKMCILVYLKSFIFRPEWEPLRFAIIHSHDRHGPFSSWWQDVLRSLSLFCLCFFVFLLYCSQGLWIGYLPWEWGSALRFHHSQKESLIHQHTIFSNRPFNYLTGYYYS